MSESQPSFFSLDDESPALILGEWLRTKYHLEDQDKWKYTIASMPDDIANRVVLTDTQPLLGPRSMRTGRTAMRWGVQIRLRSTSYPLGYRKLRSFVNALEELYREEVKIDTEVFVIHSVRQTSGVIPLGKDERDRHNFSLNVTIRISQGAN